MERITIPQDAQERINALMTTGASLIVSDQGLGPETGKGHGPRRPDALSDDTF